jgi:oxygen-independent coproporphyrinogen-3 oxidase
MNAAEAASSVVAAASSWAAAGFAATAPAPSSGLASLAAEAAAQAPTPVSLYVHVPFCVSKCAYCDFYSEVGESRRYAQFVDAALFEAGHWSHYDLLDDVPTVYIGGGTPTVIGDQLVRLVTGLLELARVRPGAEVTVETNPETTDAALVARLVEAGVNRFSLGVQSFDDAVLRTLGRCHDADKARAAVAILEDSGASFSIDLICGVPGQSFESWEATLEEAVASGARHVSVYPLSVEDGTPLAAAIAAGRVAEPDPDVVADMMLAAEVALAAAGMPRYEVASYAQPGHEARHNLVYWTGGAYLGLGPHAASMLPYDVFSRIAEGEGWRVDVAGTDAPARARFTREAALEPYLRTPLANPEPFETLAASEALREDVMLGLRLTSGVASADVEAAGVTDRLVFLRDRRLVRIELDDDRVERWRTTQSGWLLGNQVFGEVWNAE